MGGRKEAALVGYSECAKLGGIISAKLFRTNDLDIADTTRLCDEPLVFIFNADNEDQQITFYFTEDRHH
jgi:hypothetical protein